jgi:hypothetical protein
VLCILSDPHVDRLGEPRGDTEGLHAAHVEKRARHPDPNCEQCPGNARADPASVTLISVDACGAAGRE